MESSSVLNSIPEKTIENRSEFFSMSDVSGKKVLSSSTNLLDAHYSSKISVHSANHDLTNSIALSMSNVFDVIPTKKIPLVGQDVEHHSIDDMSPITSFSNFDINNCLSQNVSRGTTCYKKQILNNKLFNSRVDQATQTGKETLNSISQLVICLLLSVSLNSAFLFLLEH